jgi:hypothetical protein
MSQKEHANMAVLEDTKLLAIHPSQERLLLDE